MAASPRQDSLARAAAALVAAEAGDRNAWRAVDLAALSRLRSDAFHLIAIVPYALGRLAAQLAHHEKSSVRLEAVRLLALVGQVRPEDVLPTLARLRRDPARSVQRAADHAVRDLAPPDASISNLPESVSIH